MDPAPPELAPLEEQLPAELPRLLAYLRRLVGGRYPSLDAEDLAQDVMERALHYRHAWDPTRPLFPWLRRMAFRAFVDRLDELRRRPDARGGAHASIGPWDPAHPAGARGPGGPAAAAATDPRAGSAGGASLELRDQVEWLLSRLGPREAEILRRFHLGQQSVAHIAEALGLPAGTVKSHLHRARRQLAERGADR